MLLIAHALINCIVMATMAFLIYKSRKRPDVTASKELSLLLLAGLVAEFFSTLCLVQGSPPLKFYLNEARFFGLAFIAPATLLFTLRLLGKKFGDSKRNVAFILVIPVACLIAIWTNPFFHLFRKGMHLNYFHGISYVYGDQAPFFWVEMLYNYILIVCSVCIMFFEQYKKPAMYRGQINVLIFSMLLTMLFNVFIILRIIPDYADFSTSAFVFAAFCLYWGLFHYKPVSMTNQAKDLALSSIDNVILIFDYKGILIEHNNSAKQLFSLGEHLNNKVTVDDFLQNILHTTKTSTENLSGIQVQFQKNYYDVDDKSIYDKNGKFAGRVLVFNDITKLKSSLFAIEAIANNDYLTGLKNRHSFYAKLREMDKSERVPLVIAYGNVRNMKVLNEVFGTVFGDEVLKKIAVKLREVCGSSDICARINGDEFALVFDSKTENDVHILLSRVVCELENPSQHDTHAEQSVPIKFVYGTASKLQARENIDAVLQNASDEMNKNRLLDEKSTTSTSVLHIKRIMESRGVYSGANEDEINDLCIRLAKACGLTSDTEYERIKIFTMMHNVGNLSVPENISKKTGSLTNNEWEIMKLHTVKGYRIALSMPVLGTIANEILCHHERYDGFGYPNRMKGDEIPILVRIFTIVEYYVRHKDRESALVEMQGLANAQFDPKLMEKFLEIIFASTI